MGVNCERLILNWHNSGKTIGGMSANTPDSSGAPTAGLAIQSSSSEHTNCTLRRKRKTAAQRGQNATDSPGRGGGEDGNGNCSELTIKATTTSHQISNMAIANKTAATTESAIGEECCAKNMNVCIICRHQVEECCTCCCSRFGKVTTIATSSTNIVYNNNNGRKLQESRGSTMHLAPSTAAPSGSCQREHNEHNVRLEIRNTTTPRPTAATSSTKTAAIYQRDTMEVPFGQQQQTSYSYDSHEKELALLHEGKCTCGAESVKRIATGASTIKSPNRATDTRKQQVMQQNASAKGVCCRCRLRPCTFSSSTCNIPTIASPSSQSDSFQTTKPTPPTNTATTIASNLALEAAPVSSCAATINFELQQNMCITAATTTTKLVATSITLFAHFAMALRTLQLLLLFIQMQFWCPIYNEFSSFIYKNVNNNTNSNNSPGNSYMKTTSNKRQQKQQCPPIVRLMKQTRCNSYYNSNNSNGNNNVTNIFIASHKQQRQQQTHHQQFQYANANANNNNNNSNNSIFSNNKCSQLQHHMQHHTVQKHHWKQLLPSPISTPTSHQPMQHHQPGNKQKSATLELQHSQYFTMPNLSFLYKLLIILSFLSSINSQTSNAIATADISAWTNNAIRTAPVTLTRNETVCRSLDIRNVPGELRQLRNCTVIEGFLLITLINTQATQEFTESFPLLTEVTEFIIVYRVHNLRSLSQIFPNLSIIRGTILFEGYALIIYYNPHLEDIGLSKLTTISRGGVRIENNVMLCYVETVDWKRIVNSDAEITTENNSKLIECPKCPGDAKSAKGDGGNSEKVCKEYDGQRRCWNSKSCQKICPDRCKNNCLDEHTCCNENCLGGCSPTDLNECISCRGLSIYNNTCIDRCPPNYFSYLDRRCLTSEECIAIGTKFENNKPQKIVPYEGKCTTRCPNGYNKIGFTCQACGDNCINKCVGTHIDSVERAKDLTGCTHIIKNDLTISIKRGGKHLMEELESGLSSIQEITTFLKIQGTYGMTSLSFFKNLKKIGGDTLYEDKFALYVLENTDLESLWGENRTVHIARGRVFFHFNPKLCYSEIEKLRGMMKENATFDKNEVASDSNGHKGSCNTELLEISILKVSSRVAVVKIENPIEFEDERTFIGYQYFYMEDKYKNATKYSQRICDDGWIVGDPTKETRYIFINLQPFTQYAYYVKTLTISSEKRNAQSQIHHFKTKSAQPNPVQSLNAYAISNSEITVLWTPPANPKGNLTIYRVHAMLDKRSQVLESRNYCKDPAQIDKEDDNAREPQTTVTEPPNASNCKCDNEKSPNHSDIDTSEATIVAGIDFENTVQNFIYVKRENDTKKSKSRNDDDNRTSLTGTDAKRRKRRHSEGDPEDSFLIRHMRAMPDDFENAIIKTTVEDGSTDNNVNILITTISPLEGTNRTHDNDTRMDATGEYYENIVRNVSVTTNKYVFTNLKHFSFYMVGVEACREPEQGATEKECSHIRQHFVRTKKMDDVDKVENFRAELETTNTTRSGIRLRWNPPVKPNSDVVSYTISYKKSEQDAMEEKRCITNVDYHNKTNGYLLSGLPTGNYSIKVRPNSLAGDGIYSDVIHIYIPPEKWSAVIITVICIVVIGVIVLVGSVYWYVRRKYTPPSDIKIIPTVNPYYISLQYIPDSWEVARDRIIQLSPLGQGSFGMVYEGILKGYNNTTDDTPCAIKTVNENATDRERINFLNEASVMKLFDTYHVVRLLGVCSVGQPALVVMELMKFGDLKSYLRAHRPDSGQGDDIPYRYREAGVQPPPLSRVFQMAIEIADGMAYLSAKKFVHRDLAARNCMVGAGLTVKIGDFGMTRDIYETDYYRKGDKGLLPVRWMPPESLRDGIYSTASDVFSYGVVLWEIVTLASQPYPGYSNDQVLRFVIEGGVMERPDNCPDKIYEIMQQCWEHRPSKRPSFFKMISMLLDHVHTDSEGYLSHLREVSFFYSDEGEQEREKQKNESMQNCGAIFNEENEMDDVTTPLRTEELNDCKLNEANTSSVEHTEESPVVNDDNDHPHSPHSQSLTSVNIVSSTPDGQSKNSYNFSQMSHNNPTLLSSVPSTSAGIVSGGSQSQSHQLHQPGLHQRQAYSSQFPTDEAANYVLPDYDPPTSGGDDKHLKALNIKKSDTDERGYEVYDPSPNYREHVPSDETPDEEDFDGITTGGYITRIDSGGQQLLPHHTPHHRMPTIMPMSSSMPDEIINAPMSSSLYPSTASAASSNVSSTTAPTGRYSSLRAVADKMQSMPMRLRNINRRIFNHKRTYSNSSHKSTGSNPNTAPSSSINSNLTGSTVDRGKSMSGQHLGTIESGGSGSVVSYVTPRFFTSTTDASAALSSINPNYRLLEEAGNTSYVSGAGDATDPNTPTSARNKSAGPTTKNTNYKRLEESLNASFTPNKSCSRTTANISTVPSNSSTSSTIRPYTQTTENLNYMLMEAPGVESALHTTDNPNYMVMNESAAPTMRFGLPPQPTASSPNTFGQMSDNATYTMMGPMTRAYSNDGSSTSTVGEEPDIHEEQTEHIKMELLRRRRRDSDRGQQQRKTRSSRSRSQSQNKLDEEAATQGSTSPANTSAGLPEIMDDIGNSYVSLSSMAAVALAANTKSTPIQTNPTSTYSLKEKWLRHQTQQPPQPPPNGFIGREA